MVTTKYLSAGLLLLALATPAKAPKQNVVLQVLGKDPEVKNQIVAVPMITPIFGFRVVSGTPPEKGAIQCKSFEVHRDGQVYMQLACEGGVVLEVAALDWGNH